MPNDHEEEEEPMENWKQFQGTELGSLMSQLYGGNRNKSKISYPKPKVVQKKLPGEFRCLGAKVDGVDPRKQTRRFDVQVAVPKVGGGKSVTTTTKTNQIDLIPKRKAADKIKV